MKRIPTIGKGGPKRKQEFKCADCGEMIDWCLPYYPYEDAGQEVCENCYEEMNREELRR